MFLPIDVWRYILSFTASHDARHHYMRVCRDWNKYLSHHRAKMLDTWYHARRRDDNGKLCYLALIVGIYFGLESPKVRGLSMNVTPCKQRLWFASDRGLGNTEYATAIPACFTYLIQNCARAFPEYQNRGVEPFVETWSSGDAIDIYHYMRDVPFRMNPNERRHYVGRNAGAIHAMLIYRGAGRMAHALASLGLESECNSESIGHVVWHYAKNITAASRLPFTYECMLTTGIQFGIDNSIEVFIGTPYEERARQMGYVYKAVAIQRIIAERRRDIMSLIPYFMTPLRVGIRAKAAWNQIPPGVYKAIQNHGVQLYLIGEGEVTTATARKRQQRRDEDPDDRTEPSRGGKRRIRADEETMWSGM